MSTVRILGLWKGTDEQGVPVLAGRYSDYYEVAVKPNADKTEGDGKPDYLLHFILAPAKDAPAPVHGKSGCGGGCGGGCGRTPAGEAGKQHT